MASLIPAGDPPAARCAICGATAAGPCARCRKMVCADCCELVQGAGTFALCTRCAKSPSLGWAPVIGWFAAIILALAAVAGALVLLSRLRR